MVLSRANLRVSFFGGGSDLPEFAAAGGDAAILSCALEQRVRVLAGLRGVPGMPWRVAYSRQETAAEWRYLQNERLTACLKHLDWPQREALEVVMTSDVPTQGTGLGGSSAFVVAMLGALQQLDGRGWSRQELAWRAYRVERSVGAPVGWQDHYAAAMGGMVLLEHRQGQPRPQHQHLFPQGSAASSRVLRALQDNVQLFWTGQARSANDILEAQAQRTVEPGEGKSCNLKTLTMLSDMARAACTQAREGLTWSWGPLLDEAWQLKQTLAPGICPEWTSAAYADAKAAGMEGGKLCGAGGGGFFLAWTPAGYREVVCDVLEQRHGFRPVPFRPVLYPTDVTRYPDGTLMPDVKEV